MPARSVSNRFVRKAVAAAVAMGAATLVVAPVRAQTCTPQNTCTDPRGCPDFRVDPGALLYVVELEFSTAIETRTFAPTDCSVIEGEVPAGTNDFLVFSTAITNFGPGALTLGDPWNVTPFSLDHPDGNRWA